MPLVGEAKREYQRRWLANRRADFFHNKTCVLCGSNQRLELDHKDAKHKISHRVWSWTRLRREAELAKCQVLCHDCHVKKTIEAGESATSEARSGKLVQCQVDAILASKDEAASLGQQFGVSKWTIYKIRSGDRWKVS